MEETAQPKQAANSGPGNKKVAAKATKKSGTPPTLNPEPPQPQAEAKASTNNTLPKFASKAVPYPEDNPTSGGAGSGTSDSSNGGGGGNAPKVPAWKLALKSAAAGRAAGAAAVADVMGGGGGGGSGSDSPSKPAKQVPAWKLRNQQAASKSFPAPEPQQQPQQQTQQQPQQPQYEEEQQQQQRGIDAATPDENNTGGEESFTDDDEGSVTMNEFTFSRSGSGTPVDFGAGAKSDGNSANGGGGSGFGGGGSGDGGRSSANSIRSGSASPWREKPSLRKAARMAQMLNRFQQPEDNNNNNNNNGGGGGGGKRGGGSDSVAEPKVPAWKLANQQSALRKAAQQQQQQQQPPTPSDESGSITASNGGFGGGGSGTNSGRSSSLVASPPPPPAPTPTNFSGTTTPRMGYGCGGSGCGGGGSSVGGGAGGTQRSQSIDLDYPNDSYYGNSNGNGGNGRGGSTSRPGTDMSGAYTSEDDYERSMGRSESRGRHASDSDYESGGMTDIPSGAEDSALSGGDTDDGSGGDVDYSGRPSSAPPTLFGMSMKKVLSRPTDRVEQAERKAERLEQANDIVNGQQQQQQQYGEQQQQQRYTLSKDSLGGATQLTSSAYYSESEMSQTSTGMSGSESDPMGPMMTHHNQPRQRPENTSKQLSTLERIMGKSSASDSSDNNAGYDSRAQSKYPQSRGSQQQQQQPQQFKAQQQQQQQQQYQAMQQQHQQQFDTQSTGSGLSIGGGSGGLQTNKSAAEHRASAARGRDLIATLLSKTAANAASASSANRGGIGGGSGGGSGGAPVSNDARRLALGMDPSSLNMHVNAAPNPAPRDYQLEWEEQQQQASAEASFKNALNGGASGDAASGGGAVGGVGGAAQDNQDSGVPPLAATSATAAVSAVSGGTGAGMSALMSVRRDVDRLATQRAAAGLKPEKHGAVEVVLLRGPRQRFLRDMSNAKNNGGGNTTNQRCGSGNDGGDQESGESEKRFLSVSNGSLFMATYFTLLDSDGFVDCSRMNRNASSEKLCDLLKCTMEVVESPLSLCGYALRLCKATSSSSSSKAHSSSSSSFKEGVLLRPTRMAEFLEWASTIQQVVDAAVVAQKLSEAAAGGEGGRTEVEKMRWRRQQGMHMFKMPGDTRGADGTPGSRYAATKRDLLQLEQQKEKQSKEIAAGFERKATNQDPAMLTGSDASNQMMQSLHDVTNRPIAAAAAAAAAESKKQKAQDARAIINSSVYQPRQSMPMKNSKGGISSPSVSGAKQVFNAQDHSDPFLEDLQRLRNMPLKLPPPPPGSSGQAYGGSDGRTRDYSVATILDATSGARIGPSPANRAIFHRNFNHVKEGKAFTGGVSWLEEYRAMQRELDAMEFSTERSLGYLAGNRHKFYAMAHHKPANAYAAALQGQGDGRFTDSPAAFTAPPLLVDLNRRQFARADPESMEMPFTVV